MRKLVSRAITGRKAIGVSMLALSLLAFRGIPGWWGVVEQSRDDAHGAIRSLNDARAIIEAAPAMGDSLKARREAFTQALSFIIVAASPAEAASHLSGVVSLYASNAGVALNSMTLMSDTTATSEFGRPRVRVEARADISGLTQLLLLLEDGLSQLRVVDLVVSQSDPVGGARPEELRFSITVEGLAKMQKGERVGGAQ